MKNLFERLFKKESQFNYTIADYKPVKTSKLKTDDTMTEYEFYSDTEKDDMDIDKIYQNS